MLAKASQLRASSLRDRSLSAYSGTPLPQKLGIKLGFRVHLVNLPAEVRDQLGEALAECTTPKPPSALDFLMFFTMSRAE
jgi:hypothetical protein